MQSSNLVPHVFHWRFRLWTGDPIKDTYGGKAVLDCNGNPAFAELAVVSELKQRGFDDAVWVDSYRRCFRNAMPPATCYLPEHIREVYQRIVAINGKQAGCWDVMAWGKHGISFVECKHKGKDRMTPNEWKWLDSAIKAGLPLDKFAICEWELEQ